MKLVARATKLAYWYTCLSVIIGPLIILIGVSFSGVAAGGDCYDPSWSQVPQARTMAERSAILRPSQITQQIAASIMILVGLVILMLLAVHISKAKRPLKVILPTIGVLIMMLGYGLIVQFNSIPACGTN